MELESRHNWKLKQHEHPLVDRLEMKVQGCVSFQGLQPPQC